MWDIVWVSPQGHRSVSVSRHLLLQAPQCPCSERKRFSRDHCCRGRCIVSEMHKRSQSTLYATDSIGKVHESITNKVNFPRKTSIANNQETLTWCDRSASMRMMKFPVACLTPCMYAVPVSNIRLQAETHIHITCTIFLVIWSSSSSSYPVLVFMVLRLSRTPG